MPSTIDRERLATWEGRKVKRPSTSGKHGARKPKDKK